MFCIETIIKIWETILILEHEYYEWFYAKHTLWSHVMKPFYFFSMEDLDCVDHPAPDHDLQLTWFFQFDLINSYFISIRLDSSSNVPSYSWWFLCKLGLVRCIKISFLSLQLFDRINTRIGFGSRDHEI